MNYDEMARLADEAIEKGTEGMGLRRAEARVAESVGAVLSVRFSKDEIALLRAAAVERHIKVSALVRQAALETVMHPGISQEQIIARLDVLEQRVRDLASAK